MKLMQINSFTTVTKTEYFYWNQGPMSNKVFDAINKELQSNNLPTECEVQNVSLGVFKGSKKYLVVQGRQKELLIGISAEPYGDFLCVFVYMAVSPSVGSLVRAATIGALAKTPDAVLAGVFAKMTIADRQELNMFWASTISCIEKALADLGLTEQMKGFVGII